MASLTTYITDVLRSILPSGSAAYSRNVDFVSTPQVVTLTADYTFTNNDNGKTFIVSGSDIDLTIPAASILSSSWRIIIVNENSTNTATAHTTNAVNTPVGQKNINIFRSGSDTVSGVGTSYHGASLVLTPRTVVDVIRTSSTAFAINPSNSIGWKDIPTVPFALGANSNDPTESAIDSSFMRAFEFTNATVGNEKTLYFNIHLNHDYVMGTKVYLHCHWVIGNTNATTAVRWQFTHASAKGHGQQAFSTTGTTVNVNTTLNGTAYTHYVTEVIDADAVSATNLEPDSVIQVKILRDSANAADTCTTSAWLIFVDCHYLSTEGGTPNKAPSFYV